MLIYEVNLTVESAMAPSFEAWLPGHVREMLKLKGFERAEWYELEPDEVGRSRWSVHYVLASRNVYDDYLEHHAERMRADGKSKFGTHLTATRRLLTHRKSFD